MTSRGPLFPVAPSPAGAPAPGRTDRRRRVVPLTAGLIIGLLIGAGVVAGAWWWADRDSGALPPPIPISLATLPSEILGAQRDDLAAQAGSGKNAKDNAQRQRSMITARIPAYDAAYGGSGIDASYGALAGSRMYRLMIVNGIQPSPVATPDASVASLGLLAPSDYVEAPGSATTRCVAQPHAPVVINGDTTVAAARDQDRRMRPPQRLGRVERPLQRVVLAVEALVLVRPHLQADPQGLLQPRETLGRRRER